MLLQIDSVADKERSDLVTYKAQIYFESKLSSFKTLAEISDKDEKIVYFFKLLEHIKE